MCFDKATWDGVGQPTSRTPGGLNGRGARAGFDPLRDEGAAYAERLADAGVPVEHLDYERLCHGFLSMTDAVDAAGRRWAR